MAAGTSRRLYLDWLRGAAVLIMIEAHLLDAWTATAYRGERAYSLAMLVGGLGAPLFLFLAGVSVALSAAARTRRGLAAPDARRAIVRRGFQIFGLAFLFRAQACLLGWSSLWDLFKVDILNIMGLAIAAAGTLWRVGRSVRTRAIVFGCVAAAVAFATPLVREAPIEALPDPVEAYLRPVGSLANFVLFPWAGFLFAGGLAGVILESVPAGRDRSAVTRIGLAGLMVAMIAYACSYLPSPYPTSRFWSTSPAYFFLQTGILAAAILAAYAWGTRDPSGERWSPLRQLGRTSLFIYWIHVEMLYGLISRPLHASLSTREALVAFLFFSAFMLLCSAAKEHVVKRWRGSAIAPLARAARQG
ncbi:MAG TPA: heparan-alpha-glucosaminide N-acetyltransferase domain-containing protein [Vicinamibacterales bacterium]|nr:heparan-alpha-glucosaminide N-acetyltransferase domain-containing protein [Vicinamibacterales bacterium]